MAQMKKTAHPHNIAYYDTAVLHNHVDVLHAPSLTRKLRSLDAQFSVQLLFLGESTLWDDERQLTTSSENPSVWSREVFLCLNNTPVISARSVCLSGSQYWRNTLNCGTQSLGEQLFAQDAPPIERTPFTWSLLPIGHRLLHTIKQPAWVRRSIFSIHRENLLLSECFLPDLQDFL